MKSKKLYKNHHKKLYSKTNFLDFLDCIELKN